MLSFSLKIYCTAPSRTAKPAVDVTQAAVSPRQIPGTPHSFHRVIKAPKLAPSIQPAWRSNSQLAGISSTLHLPDPCVPHDFGGWPGGCLCQSKASRSSARADRGPVDRAWQCNSSAQASGEASCVLSLVGCIDRVSACLMKENMAILSLECQLCFSALKIQLGVPQSNICLPAG